LASRAAEWAVLSARATLDRHKPRIRGGSDTLSDEAIRERIRALLSSGVLSRKPPTKMFVGPSAGGRFCAICGGGIAQGEMEFESSIPAEVSLVFHRRCADLRVREANGGSAA
jgi:hypothetical protein